MPVDSVFFKVLGELLKKFPKNSWLKKLVKNIFEQKILDIVKEHPEVIHDPEKRKEIAEQHGLSEKTLRNRIGDFKKYGVLFSENEIEEEPSADHLFKGNKNLFDFSQNDFYFRESL